MKKAGYLDVSPVDLGENARRDIVLNLEDMGIEVESSHHETAPAQHEVDFKYGEVRTIADRIMSFKMTVRTIAKRHGLRHFMRNQGRSKRLRNAHSFLLI